MNTADPDTNPLYDKDGNAFTAALLDFFEQKNIPRAIIMIQENLTFLQENVKYMGFGDKLNDQIAKNMEQGVPEFTLKTAAAFHQKNIEGGLHFRKSDKSDMYFFNSYTASLKDEAKGDERSQAFYIENGKGVTFKEAFNLLEGRAVHRELTNKEGQSYNAWVQLDFEKGTSVTTTK